MGKKPKTSDAGGCRNLAILLAITSCSFVLAYAFFSQLFAAPTIPADESATAVVEKSSNKAACCRGVNHLELWGQVAIWGDQHITNTSQDCCRACKKLCKPEEGARCECNSWVFCGDKEKCGDRLGQCWLKFQDDPLRPDIQDSGQQVMWTSGLVYEKGMGIVGLETQHGIIRMQLLVDCAPYGVAYLLELLKLRHCAGCRIYRAEGRGTSWNEEGEQIGQKTTEGPYGLVQGSLAVQTIPFTDLPIEACPAVQRGSVGWIGRGPDFFISLANHSEWFPKYTIFAHVLKEDMHIVEKIATLPTEPSAWSGVNVAVLKEAIPIKLVRTTHQVAPS